MTFAAAGPAAPPRPARFFNTLGRELVPLEPVAPGKVSIYTCGPTVYNHVHIGNLRTFLFEDVLRRALRYLGYEVTQVMNLTDVDDKTIRGAQQAGVSLDEFTAPFIDSFFADLDTLHVDRAELYPRATRHVPEMIALTERLLARGVAYRNEGSVWFRIADDPDYGRLSGVDLEQVQQGDRVASDEYGKEDVRDFVLWKGAKPGEPSWDSPWGPGRPGWHIECSAMAMKYLGESFDVHCGGVDNMFPHHENEIAQSESATGKPFARLWLHSEHLVVEGQNMAKSAGNFYTLKELAAAGRDPRAIRYLLLSVHYRQKLNFTFEALDAAAAALSRVDDLRLRLQTAVEGAGECADVAGLAASLRDELAAALGDDLNTSGALGALFRFVKAVNVAVDERRLGAGDRERVVAALDDVDRVLGVLDASQWRHGEASGPSDAEIEQLIAERQAARQARQFARADEIRQQLLAQGVVLEDTAGGTRWKRRASPAPEAVGGSPAVSRAGEFGEQPHAVGRGRVAEDAAAAWLETQGYRVVERNHRNGAGEIDLVAEDGDTLCFVEVKARTDTLYGPALAAVGPRKQRRVSRAAALYLALRGFRGPCRFDVLAMEVEEGSWRFTLVRDAFSAG